MLLALDCISNEVNPGVLNLFTFQSFDRCLVNSMPFFVSESEKLYSTHGIV